MANGQYFKLANFKGEFPFHSHADEDEFFLVHRGEFTMCYRDREVVLKAGDFHVVPRGRRASAARDRRGVGDVRRAGRDQSTPAMLVDRNSPGRSRSRSRIWRSARQTILSSRLRPARTPHAIH